ncbi:unnamed protein product [Adineta steineri]|uniref:Cyclin-dependent kinase 2-associated protein n=2 Tax=Adineta steineri TaxID=433720 RepID=A0A819F6G2_9BILA|nr:unnamed protein product [Adineta steineri]CAF3860514.1 unnamed protein product [Adineta steineri]
MDLSIRKQEQSPTIPSRPILNPATSTSLIQSSTGQNSPHITIPSVSSHNSNHKQQFIPIPPVIQQQQQQQKHRIIHQSKYAQLLNVIEEMGKDIKPTYAGNKNSAERLRRAIASARILTRECQLECDRNNRS